MILASSSEYKRQLLERLGLEFDACSADVDEAARSGETPSDTAKRLARRKATAVRRRRPDAWVLGADQTIEIDGERLAKPGDPETAMRQLRRLAGRTHQLHCSVAVATPAQTCRVETVHFEMVMRELDDGEIRAYVDEDRPLDCAGSYMIERAGIRLFRAMRGDDYTAIVGLPLTRVWNILEATNYFSGRSSDSHPGGGTG